ncbi:MAG: hypothetical protein NTW87_03240, partial [Planctomycetota bacterium]|nr:hypothetical protein [Planctomycetota bacterium]
KADVLLSAACVLSGLCALIYETLRIYKFSRIFGSTVFAMSFVVRGRFHVADAGANAPVARGAPTADDTDGRHAAGAADTL